MRTTDPHTAAGTRKSRRWIVVNTLRFVGAGAVLALILRACFSYQPVSELTGGKGQVVSNGMPVVDATVSIKDMGGVLQATTDEEGRFDIAVDSRRQLFLSMANPLRHGVTVVIKKDDAVLMAWTFEKRVLGPNYFELGVIDVERQPTGRTPMPSSEASDMNLSDGE